MTKKVFAFLILVLCFTNAFLAQDIFDAARKGDTTRIKDLMKINPDTIHKINKDGFSALILASYRDQLATAEFLMRQKVDIDYVSPEGTALMAAVYKNQEVLVQKLIDKHCNLNLSNDIGTTALMLAVSGNQLNMVTLLLKHKCDTKLKDKEGNTALQIAQRMKNERMVGLLSL